MVSSRPEMLLGVAFACAVIPILVFGCLFLPINRAAFWRGFMVGWMLMAGVGVSVGGVILVATKLRLMP